MRDRLFAGALILAALGFVALGIWQLERRVWKLDLIARVDARIHAPPTPLADWRGLGPGDAYRRVTVRGVLLGDRQTLVQALTVHGAGWWVMTPLQTAAGPILINRGFIPTARAGAPMPANPRPVTITGLIRASEPGGGFLRANDPVGGRWYSRDVQAIGAARGLAGVAPIFIDADATPNAGGYPIGGLTVVSFPNSHLVYALTWFVLAALSGGGGAMVLKRGGDFRAG